MGISLLHLFDEPLRCNVICPNVSDDESTDKIVSVQVDGEESMLQFIDCAGTQVSRVPAAACNCGRCTGAQPFYYAYKRTLVAAALQ